VCGEARAVLRAGAADFQFNGCQLEVSTDKRVRHITGCVDDYATGLRLKAFQYLDVGCRCCAPELDAISPDWFEGGFVEKGELRSASGQPVHLSEGESVLLPFGEDMVRQVSFLSRCSPRYSTWSAQGGCTLFM
jgi:hypothetical protein